MTVITTELALELVNDSRELYECRNDRENLTEFRYAGGTVAILQVDIDAAKVRINASLAAFQVKVAALEPLV